MEGKIVFIICNNSMLVPVFPVYSNRMAYYPVLPGFASTVQKVMGQDLPHMTLVFDKKNMSPAAGCCFVKSSVSWQCCTYAMVKEKSFFKYLSVNEFLFLVNLLDLYHCQSSYHHAKLWTVDWNIVKLSLQFQYCK